MSARIIVPLLIFAVLAIPSLLILDYSSVNPNVNFTDDNRDAWFTFMEERFGGKLIGPDQQTTYAVEVGLDSVPELQSSMRKRLHAVESHRAVWPWKDFKEDITRVSEEAKQFRSDGVSSKALQIMADTPDFVLSQDLDVVQAGIHIPDISIPPIDISLPDLPSPEEIFRRIREALERAKKQLDEVIRDGSSRSEEVLQKLRDFVSVQIALLPKDLHMAVELFTEYRKEHPYIVAAATVALVIVGTELVVPWALLGIFRLLGFGELGPIAGSWAAALQSVFYGAHTRGLFSILQRITMSAKAFWPAAVFLDLAAVGLGTIVVWTREMVKEIVDTWYPEMVMPDLNLLVQDDHPEAVTLLDEFMKEVGRRCTEVGIPEVQWLDVAIESVRRAVQDMVDTNGL